MNVVAVEPLVTVIMPARNASSFIRLAVASLQAQTYPQWILYIVNDCSEDATAEIISQMAEEDARIHYINNKEHLGVAVSRNLALERARTRYVAFLDSDDLWHPVKLEAQISFMKQSNTSITYADYWRISNDGRIVGCVRVQARCTQRDMLSTNHIGNLTGVYDRERLPSLRFETVGNEDYLFWLSALTLLAEPIFATPSAFPLASYRITPNSLTSSKLRSANWQWQIYRSHLGLSKFRSCICMFRYACNALFKRWPMANRMDVKAIKSGVPH